MNVQIVKKITYSRFIVCFNRGFGEEERGVKERVVATDPGAENAGQDEKVKEKREGRKTTKRFSETIDGSSASFASAKRISPAAAAAAADE